MAKGYNGVKVRADQTLYLQLIVTLLTLVKVYLVVAVLSNAPLNGAEWMVRQRWFSVLISCLSIWCLWGATLTHPGIIPSGWNGASNSPTDQEVMWCKACEHWKPVRTHHCSQCQMCVPRFDHHCDWIDNCVGQRNHRYFLLFLVYITLCIVHYFFMLYQFSVAGERRVYTPLGEQFKPEHLRTQVEGIASMGTGLTVFVVVYSLCAFGLFFFAGAFLSCTSWQVFSNMTSYDESVGGEGADYGYSRGWMANISEVLGPHPLLWLVPAVGEVVADTRHARALKGVKGVEEEDDGGGGGGGGGGVADVLSSSQVQRDMVLATLLGSTSGRGKDKTE